MQRDDSVHPEELARVFGPNLGLLRTFHLVAELRSFTRAGQALHLSQPAVSAHIRTLERSLHTPLFVIRHRRVFLTAEAEALLEFTRRVFHLLREAEHAVNAVRGLERGRLVLAASHTVAEYLLPPILKAFASRHPGIDVEVTVGTTSLAAERVLSEHASLALVEAPFSHDDLEAQPFAEDEVVLVAPASHPWASRGVLSPHDLQGAALLRREAGSGTGAQVDAALLQAGVQIRTAMVLGSAAALKQAVLAGLGAAWIPRLVVTGDVTAGDLVIVAVKGVAVRRTLWRLVPRALPLSAAARAFCELLGRRAHAGMAPGT